MQRFTVIESEDIGKLMEMLNALPSGVRLISVTCNNHMHRAFLEATPFEPTKSLNNTRNRKDR